ncbi:hypothetical protein ABI59_19630 [Acidobacteria bacterium Mor1]|nr:hypothetical protein ABI59_19630 [Acidobacteria bacterium Mor1]
MKVWGEGPLVIKIAGLAGGVRVFTEECKTAAADGFRVAAVDTRGDRRDDPAPGPLGWDALSEDIARAMDELGDERAVLWGTSFGALVSLAFAARYPDRTAGLLLAVPPAPHWQPGLYRWVLRRISSGRFRAPLSRGVLALAMVLTCGWEFLYPTVIRRVPTLFREARQARTPGKTYAEKSALLCAQTLELPGALREIPISIVGSSLDLLAPTAGTRRLAERLPHARYLEIGWAGHSVSWSRPKTYHRLSLAELRRLTGRSG